MLSILVKLFIKNSKNYSNAKVRTEYGILCGAFGIFLNIILFVLKFVFGSIAASVAMIADGFNNLSDAASSLIQIFGFKLASKKPDIDHPFGHGRMEYVSGLIISFLIIVMGFELLKSSLDKIIHPDYSNEQNIFTFIVLALAIVIKFYMYFYNHIIAQKINSVTMEATAKDSLSDTISTFVVIISLIIQQFVKFPVDGIAGIIVALFIFKTGIESASDTIKPLLGTTPDESFVDEIEKELMRHKPIIGMHDLVVHDYGPGRVMVSLHAEVPGVMNIFEIHDAIDNAEVDISKKFDCQVVIHMDPIDTNNERLLELKKLVKEECINISPKLNCHDVRMVPGITHTNLIFDIVKPFDCMLSDDELTNLLNGNIHKKCPDVFCVITVDQPFIK